MIVNILGTDYTLRTERNEDEAKIADSNGYCEPYSKEIVIADFEEGEDVINNLNAFRAKVTRHEIIHAFLQESGLSSNSCWATNEEMVDWFALQFGKIAKVFKEVGCE